MASSEIETQMAVTKALQLLRNHNLSLSKESVVNGELQKHNLIAQQKSY